jgi:hypothetical protein
MAKLPIVTSATTSAGPTRITTVPAGGSSDAKVHYDTDTGALVVEKLDAPLFTDEEKGLVPASGGGEENFLRADGTWATPAGGTGTVDAVTGVAPISVDSTDPANPQVSIAISFGAEYFVNTSGNDTTGDGTSIKPFATITKAVTVANAVEGTGFLKINVSPGDYTGSFNITRRNIFIQGAGSEGEEFFTKIYGTVTVDSTGTTNPNTQQVGLDGLYIYSNAAAPAVRFTGSGSEGLIISGCYLGGSNTTANILWCDSNAGTQSKVTIRNTTIQTEANAFSASIVKLSYGNIRFDTVRVYDTSGTGSANGVETLNSASVWADRLFVDVTTSGVAIFGSGTSSAIKLLATNSGFTNRGNTSTSHTVSVTNGSLGAGNLAGYLWQCAMAVFNANANAITGTLGASGIYYGGLTYGPNALGAINRSVASGVTMLALGEKLGNLDRLDFQTTPAESLTALGQVGWDDTANFQTLKVRMGNANSVVDAAIGQSTYHKVYNATGAVLAKGAVVYVSGAQGDQIAVSKAQATSDSTSTTIVGVVAGQIGIGSSGFVITEGMLLGLSGISTGNGFVAGTPVWLSPSTAGGIVPNSQKPSAPNHLVLIGYCVKTSNGSSGEILVNIQNGYELEELHNVAISDPQDSQPLVYESDNATWKNGSVSQTYVTDLTSDLAAKASTTYVDNQDTATLNSAKAFAEGLAYNISSKAPVHVTTTVALPSYTFLSNVLTATVSGPLTSTYTDSHTLEFYQRILVKDEAGANQKYNGIYYLSQVGETDVSPWKLTRSEDANTAGEICGSTVPVETGSTNSGTLWVFSANSATFVLNTDAVIWNNLSASVSDATPTVKGKVQLAGAFYSTSTAALPIIDLGATSYLYGTLAYSKLSLTSSILDADISASAAIARSKLAVSVLEDKGKLLMNDASTGAIVATPYASVAQGGTGQISLTLGSYLVGNGSNAVSFKTAAEVTADLSLFSTTDTTRGLVVGSNGAANTFFLRADGAWAQVAATGLTGQVALTNGGTNANLTAINGGVVYSTNSALALTAAGTSGQVLKSNGAAAPAWTDIPYDISSEAVGAVSNSDVIMRFFASRTCTIVAGTYTGARCVTAPTGSSATFDIKENGGGTAVGTITFTAGSNTGTVSIASNISLTGETDYLTIECTAANGIATVFVTLKGIA